MIMVCLKQTYDWGGPHGRYDLASLSDVFRGFCPRGVCAMEKDTARAITSSSVSAVRSRQSSSNSSSWGLRVFIYF